MLQLFNVFTEKQNTSLSTRNVFMQKKVKSDPIVICIKFTKNYLTGHMGED